MRRIRILLQIGLLILLFCIAALIVLAVWARGSLQTSVFYPELVLLVIVIMLILRTLSRIRVELGANAGMGE